VRKALSLDTPGLPPSLLTSHFSYSGEGTVYLQYGVAGSCGTVHADSALIVALGDYWMNYEYKAPYCGDTIHVTNVGSNDNVGGAGNTVTVTVADT
jgi:hypothetical protein